MSSSILRLLCAATLLFVSFSVAAQRVLTYEPFAYGVTGANVGDLNRKNGGSGFGGPFMGPRQLPILAAWWPLDTDTSDSSGQGIHGVMMGSLSAASFVTDKPVPWSTGSLSFDGVTDYIDLDAHLSTFRFANMGTISAWFKTTAAGANTIFSISDSTSGSIETSLGISLGQIYFSTRAGGYMSSGSTIRSANTYNDGLWHHVAWVVSRSQMTTIYVDGVSILTAPTFQALAGNLPRADRMAIGRNVDSGGPQWYYQGLLDDVSFFGVPLSATDVQSMATTLPLTMAPANDTGGPDLLAASLTSAAFESRGLRAAGNRFSHRGTVIRALGSNSIDLDKDGAYYASMLLRRDDTVVGTVSPIFISFNAGTTVVGRIGWDTGGLWRAGASTVRSTGRTMATQTTYFVIVRWQTSAAGSDAISFKVYEPADSVHADASQLSGQGSGINQWDVENVTFTGSGTADRILFDLVLDLTTVEMDEMRIGTSWDSVTRPDFGAGCFGAEMTALGLPQLGSTTYQVNLGQAPVSSPGFFLVGLTNRNWGALALPLNLGFMGASSCELNVSLDLMIGIGTDASGAAALPISIPNTPGLVDQTIFSQWVVDGPAALATSLVATPGLQITVMR